MTTLILFCFMVVILAIGLFNPVIVGLAYVWLSTLYPQVENFGALALPWTFLSVCVLTAGLLLGRINKLSYNTPVFWVVVLFYLWTCFTTLFAQVPVDAWARWYSFTRVIIPFCIFVGLFSTIKELNLLVWALFVGAAAIALGGFLQIALAGGFSTVMGPPASPYAGNNEVARLIGVSGLPFALFFAYHAQGRWIRILCAASALSCALAIVGTTSRGAFVALAALVFYWFLISRWKLRLAVIAVCAGALLAALMVAERQDSLFAKMQTIENPEGDVSFQGRMFAWRYAMNVAAASPVVGGGFMTFELDRGPGGPWVDAHSIYFEALGEHGYVGLVLYLIMLSVGYFRASAIKRKFWNDPRHYWERDLAIAAQMSLIFFLVGGLTISSTYAEYLFFTLLIIAVLDKISQNVEATAGSSAPGRVRFAGAMSAATAQHAHSPRLASNSLQDSPERWR